MKVLIVGAGAVGQVYGKHFHDGGAEVAFFVREKYAPELRAESGQGLAFYPLKTARRPRRGGADLEPVRWKGFGVITGADQVRTFFGVPQGTSAPHSVVLLSVSSTALYAGEGRWLDEIIAAMPSGAAGATLVMLQPGLDDRDYVLGKLGAHRASQLVQGGITLVAYHAPLPGGAQYGGRPPEAHPVQGMAYWLPPGQPAMFAGDASRVQAVRAALEAGGFATRTSPDLQKENIVGMPALTVLVCALEASHWSFEELLSGPHLELASRALRESVAVFARLRGVSMPATPTWLVSRPAAIRLILHGSKYVVPFDFETYLQVHFTKVGEQMHQGLRDFIRHGDQAGLPTPAVQQLLAQLNRPDRK